MRALRQLEQGRAARRRVGGVAVVGAAVTLAATLAFASLVADPAGAAAGPQLSVAVGAGTPISPLIYGMNFADDQAGAGVAASIGLPINRWGGNTTDTYNWQLGAENLGNDWYFENVADCYTVADNYCNNGAGPNVSAYQQFVAADRAIGAQTLLTLPLMGYVAKTAPLGHPLTCGFPTSVFASQDSFDPYDAGCGDGQSGGSDLASDPTRDGVAIDPASNAAAWVTKLVSLYGTAAAGGVGYYELGNEPALWDSTHRDMHPAATTYDELWQKSETTAAAVKAVDPSAKILAFSEWGWPNYFCSADDGDGCTASSPDRAAHGGLPIVAWLLSQAHAYDESHGGHLFDYLDLHYYRAGGESTDVTRSLWDPSYTDPSWIDQPIDLIPRMQQWVADYDPGIGTSLSEYNLSIDSNQPNYAVTNALIQADTLGIFARQGLDIATRWSLPNDGPDIADAFEMYRDYDGHGARFGDLYMPSQSSDQSALAVYGATRSSDGALTVMVINKTSNSLTSPLALSGFEPATSAQVWQWSGEAIEHEPDQPVASSGLSATYPADSITLLVIPRAGASVPGTTTTTTGTTTGAQGHAKPLTRAEKLAAALRACLGLRRLDRRAACEAAARRRFGHRQPKSEHRAVTKHSSASVVLAAGETRALSTPYPDALEYGNARYSGRVRVVAISGAGAKPSLAKVRILSSGASLGGSQYSARVHNGNAPGTAAVRVTVIATTVEPLPHR
jgi:hypothetical protein